MTYQNTFLGHIRLYGQSAVFVYHDEETTCPCWNTAGTGYNPQWHRENNTAEDCEGTGKIGGDETELNVKGFLVNPGLRKNTGFARAVDKIGEIPEGAMVCFGLINVTEDEGVAANVRLNPESYNLKSCKITFDSDDYAILECKSLPFNISDAYILRKL
jgi:hypothetical protein